MKWGSQYFSLDRPITLFRRKRHAGLLVRLHLGHVDDHVGFEDRIRNAVLVMAAAVVRDRRVSVAPMKAEIGDRGA